MELPQEKRNTLIQHFTVSVAAFEFARTVSGTYGEPLPLGKMEALHRALLERLKSDERLTVAQTDKWLAEMEQLTDQEQAPKFRPGGIVND